MGNVMLITLERPTDIQIARRAWKSMLEAARQMWPLFLGSLFVLIVVASRGLWLPGYAAWQKQLLTEMSPFIFSLIMTSVSNTISLILLAPLAVAVHRFVLLGEVRKTPYFFNRTSLKFAGMLLAFQILGFLVLPLQLWGAPRAITLFHSLAYFAIVCWTMLVFPAVAVEEKNAKGRLRTAILRARGNFWKILRCMLLISIVLGLPWFVLLMSYNICLGKLLQSGVPQFLLSSYYLLMNNAFRLLLAALGAATVSHLYSYAAHRAQEPEVQPVT